MRALLLFATCALGCNAVWGIEAAEGVLDGGNVADAADSASESCPAEAGVARVCLTFEALPHPSYDVESGADTLRIDGNGVMYLLIFDEDPSDPTVPFKQVRLPLDGSELDIKSFPWTTALTTTPGRHWLIAQYEDNNSTPRTGGNGFLAGDFATVPTTSSSGRSVYASFDAVMDQAVRANVVLHPLRRVNFQLQVATSFRSDYPQASYGINGDGPLAFAVFDGAFNPAVPFLHLAAAPCFNAKPYAAVPLLLSGGFATHVVGEHNVVAALEDYDNKGIFPTKGSLLTPTEGVLPSVFVLPSRWSTTTVTKMNFVKVVDPYPPGAVDELRCQ